jgi:hypothetical protein
MVRSVKRLALVLAVALTFVGVGGVPAPPVPTPSEFLKMDIGGDGVLADYPQIVSYFKALDALSDRITVRELGTTTEGQTYILAIISSPENLAQLDRYRDINGRLYDARKTTEEVARTLVAQGKTFVAIQMSIHATEVGGAQMSTELAWRFATENTPRMRDVLDNTIVLLSPSHNPDGLNLVAGWNRRMLGTRFAAAPLPFLYQKYVGHDNNRDWYMFTQKESRISVEKIWNAYRPQISYDVHQMGTTAARLFVPPYIDPYDPNVDPILRAEINALGTSMASHLTGEGKDGVVVQAMYDAWTPARGYVNYHGGVRILTEAASARLASPVTVPFEQLSRGIGYDAKRVSWNFPRPWRGGAWRLRDIMDYEHDAVDALLDHAAKYREHWLLNFYRVSRNAIGRRDPETGREKPYAIVVPAGPSDVASRFTMLRALQLGDVEIHRAKTAFTADGRSFPAGSHVMLMAQPASSYAKTLTEVQRYPDLREYPGGPPQRPYDVTAYTMPLLMGVETVAVQQPFQADLEPVTAALALPRGSVHGQARRAYVFEHDNAGIMALNRLAGAGLRAIWVSASISLPGRQFPAGSIVVPVEGQKGVHEAVAAAAQSFPIEVYPVDGAVPNGLRVSPPRVGLYRSHYPAMDEGWTRWIFEQWAMPFTSLQDREVRAGNLAAKYDAILIPSQDTRGIVEGFSPGTLPEEYVGGIGKEGIAALRSFAEEGGTLVALDAATAFPVDVFRLPVRDAVRGFSITVDNEPASFYAPGSILRTRVDVSHPIAWGCEEQGIAWFEQSPAFVVSGNARAVVTYPVKGDVLLSGWLLGGNRLNGKAAVVEVPLGKGRIVLFGFRPQYRAQTWSTFKLLFNTLYYATARDDAALR